MAGLALLAEDRANLNRKLSTSSKFKHLLQVALSFGMSWWWRRYSHGKHRQEELLLEGNQPAKARGRPKGWIAKLPKLRHDCQRTHHLLRGFAL